MTPGRRVRPTADRVRESLFSILGERLPGADLLDAYSGSGALGFEALSRGARGVVFIESDRAVLAVLRQTAAALGLEGRCRVLGGRVLELLGRGAAPGPYDLILADPPYAGAEACPFLASAAGLLRPSGLLVLERPTRASPVAPPAGRLGLVRQARYGSSTLQFFAPPDS